MNKPYCKPWNAGLASETKAVCKRIGAAVTLLDSLSHDLIDGTMPDHVHEFRAELVRRLEAEGYSVSYDGGNRLKVRPPGHKRPFRRAYAP